MVKRRLVFHEGVDAGIISENVDDLVDGTLKFVMEESITQDTVSCLSILNSNKTQLYIYWLC